MFLITAEFEKQRAFRLNTDLAALATAFYYCMGMPAAPLLLKGLLVAVAWLVSRIMLSPFYLWASTRLGRGLALVLAHMNGRGTGLASVVWCVEGTAFTLMTVGFIGKVFFGSFGIT